ncbi:hypothetical protein [Thalassobius vesicularis]|nr:hypothetical protein [Thalassobius vesicularis]
MALRYAKLAQTEQTAQLLDYGWDFRVNSGNQHDAPEKLTNIKVI